MTHSDNHALIAGTPRVSAIIAGLILATFAIDLFTPRGVADGVPYVLPVFLASWLPWRRAVLSVAGVSTVLIFVGFFLSPPGTSVGIALWNRGLVLLIVWLAAGLALQHKRTQEREKQFFRLSNDLLCIAGFDGSFKRLNPAWERVLGYSRDELMARPYLDFVHPHDQPATTAEAQKLTRGIETIYFENRYRCKDGSYRWLAWNTTPALDQELLFAVARDVTDVKEAQDEHERAKEEETQRKYEAQYRDLVEHALYGIYRATIEGRFIYVNPALVKMLGYDSKEELLTKNLATDVYRVLDGRTKIVEQAVHTGQVGPVEVEWKKKDDSRIRVRLSGRALRDGNGGTRGLEAIVENVTEQHALEQQFRQAQKMEAVGRLVGGVAHDFNNLLGVIIGYTELLAERCNSQEPMHHQIVEIYKAGKRAADLTRQLLAFSRQQVLEPRVLNLNEAVDGISKMIRRLIGEDIELVTLLDPALLQVKADPGQLEQVLMNLAVNARDAMPEGGKLTIETANVELDEGYARQHYPVAPGHYVMLAVTDTGVGMDGETQRHIFEPFFTTKELGKGTGLGLATVYGIVKQSGGYIWVYTELGRGTTFKVYLPRVDEPAEKDEKQAMGAEQLRGSETILVVEDEESLREVTCEFLGQAGYTVLAAKDGIEALQVAEQHEGPIHALITDTVMPRMGGRELAERLLAARPEIAVLYASGYADNAAAHQRASEKSVPFLAKPYTRERLCRKVRQVLQPRDRDTTSP